MARPGHAVHLTVAAHALGPNTSLVCPSQARLLVRTAGRALLLCPDPAAAPLHLLSQPASSSPDSGLATALVRLAGTGRTGVTFSWAEVVPGRGLGGLAGGGWDTSRTLYPPTCPHYCHSLPGCLAPALWCDGMQDCPAGEDELACSHLQVTLHYCAAPNHTAVCCRCRCFTCTAWRAGRPRCSCSPSPSSPAGSTAAAGPSRPSSRSNASQTELWRQCSTIRCSGSSVM